MKISNLRPLAPVNLLALAAGLLITLLLGGAGCSVFKPDTVEARHFILTPVDVPVPPPAAAPLSLGLGQIKLPDYLFDLSLAVRRGTNEMDYLPMALWAERLDSGIQRILAANLTALLPADSVRLSAWQPNEVTVGVYVTIEQFDVDAQGHGVLVAGWRLMSPDGTLLRKTGHCRLAHDGPRPAVDPRGAVANLSGLLGDFSRQLAHDVKSMQPF